MDDLLEASREVIRDCSLPNGAIVASNSDAADYPVNVAHYRKVWPRDAAYICVAADLLELYDVPSNFFHWMMTRMEGFEEGELYNGYRPNGEILGNAGPMDFVRVRGKYGRYHEGFRIFATQMQIDQYGALLWAVHHHWKSVGEFDEELVLRLKDKLCRMWRGDHFGRVNFDLWEERATLPKYRNVFTYTLAMSILGLECADEMIGLGKGATAVLGQMRDALDKGFDSKLGRYKRTFRPNKSWLWWRNKEDGTADSSLLSLVWPAGLVDPGSKEMKTTVGAILGDNDYDGGILRYAHDFYSGRWEDGWYVKDGAGAWPLLSFWMAMYYSRAGKPEEAGKHFDWVVERVEKKIPEQIFVEPDRPSISPLAWSHAMFVIAAHELGKFK